MDCKVKFYDNDELVYTLSTKTGLDDINVSEEKISGSDYFSKVPRRIEFTHPVNDWLNNHVMTANYENNRNISNYKVEFYADNKLYLTGVLDTSFVKYDERTELMSFIIYDYLKLLNTYSDITVKDAMEIEPDCFDEPISPEKILNVYTKAIIGIIYLQQGL